MKKLKIDLKIGFESLDIGARDPIAGTYLGRYKSVFKGRGLEFDSYRQYGPDDDAALIDWKASARSDKLLVKEFTEERNMTVFFLIDASNTMIIGSQPKLKCEYAAELAASLGYHILNSGDNLGYALFNEKIVSFRPPERSLSTHAELIDTLSDAQNYGGNYDLKPVIDFLLELLPEKSLVIIISDFIGLIEGWEEAVKQAASKFSLIGIMIRDPIDRSIPAGLGQLAIADPLGSSTLIIDPNTIKPFYDEEARREEEHIKSVFLDNGSDFTILQTDKDFIGSVIELFESRGEKWR